jgi:hypothetical protein
MRARDLRRKLRRQYAEDGTLKTDLRFDGVP